MECQWVALKVGIIYNLKRSIIVICWMHMFVFYYYKKAFDQLSITLNDR